MNHLYLFFYLFVIIDISYMKIQLIQKKDCFHKDRIDLGTRKLKDDADFIDWIKTAGPVKFKVSVCTGSLLWGVAGFLKDKKATTHPNVYELLEPYCSEVIPSRIVKDGNVITAGGVATSIDLGLFIIRLFAGAEAAHVVKKQLDYPYTAVGIVEV